jgi:hypothetical protein
MSGRRWGLLASLLAGCAPSQPAPSSVPGTSALMAAPASVAFTCVAPGCDTTTTVRVASTVNRPIAVQRVALSDPTRDVTAAPAQAVPFVLGPAADFAVAVRYRPSDQPPPEGLRLLIAFADASLDLGPERLQPGELAIPLVPRLVGEARLAASPGRLDFGVVPPGSRKALGLRVLNSGFGNIALTVAGWDAGAAPLQVALPSPLSLAPDAGADLEVAWAPAGEQYLEGVLQLSASTPGVDPVVVPFEGTSLGRPHLAVVPEAATVDFGEVPRGASAHVTVRLANLGGQALTLSRVLVADPLHDLSARLPVGAAGAVLGPLQRLDLDLALDARTAGALAATVELFSDDPARPRLQLEVTGTVTQPALEATPAEVGFGVVPVGWVKTRSVELRNVGFGALEVRRIGLVGGSASAFTLAGLPTLPVTLQRDQRATFELEFAAQGAVPFSGAVAVETDVERTPVLEVPVSATGASCQVGCPLPHGTPSCAGGTCSVGACSAGWYDANHLAADGCECAEVGTDAPSFCGSAVDQGTLPDNGARASVTGILPLDGDVDWIRFFAEDQSQFFFSDAYLVRIRLTSSDPTLQLCVYRFDTAAPTSACFLADETCTRDFSRAGTWGPDDSAEYHLRVFRAPGAAPTCTPYTVWMSNG